MVASIVGLVVMGFVYVHRSTADPLSQAEQERLVEANARAVAATASPTKPSLKSLRADGDLSIYYIGDSITDGWNASSQDMGYRPDLTRLLGADGHVTETSVYRAGATLDDVRAMATLPTKVDVAVIELGTNDVGATTDPVAFGASYAQLAGSLAQTSGRLVCVGVLRDGKYAVALDEQIERVCDRDGGAFVSITDLWHAPGMFDPQGTPDYPGTADGGHPNDAGHAEIARRIMAALKS